MIPEEKNRGAPSVGLNLGLDKENGKKGREQRQKKCFRQTTSRRKIAFK
jgi:hypothetical protein